MTVRSNCYKVQCNYALFTWKIRIVGAVQSNLGGCRKINMQTVWCQYNLEYNGTH